MSFDLQWKISLLTPGRQELPVLDSRKLEVTGVQRVHRSGVLEGRTAPI